MGKKIFIIAGEASGDLHGKNLVKALLEKDPSLEIQAYGGDKMKSAGAKIVRNYESYAFMGFFEVVKNLRTVLSNIKTTKNLILDFQPDIIIFIDFPGFNLRVAKALKPLLTATKFYYYIAPQVWAWKSNRVHSIDKLMDRIFVILPFEKAFFKKYGYEVEYVGHPLLDEIKTRPSIEKRKKTIAVLPGSRMQEIQKMLPHFAALAEKKPQYQFEISKMPHIPLSFYERLIESFKNLENIKFSRLSTYDLLASSELAIVTSGTATLETALLGIPQLVAYKTSAISYWIAKRVVKIKYISLVNLILDREVVTELIQDKLNIENLQHHLEFLAKEKNYKQVQEDYEELKLTLGNGSASQKVAQFIIE